MMEKTENGRQKTRSVIRIYSIEKPHFSWILSSVFCLLSSIVFASFEELPTGARPAGMGNAFTTVADDVYAMCFLDEIDLGWEVRGHLETDFLFTNCGLCPGLHSILLFFVVS
jgi:hypothetical protein